MDQRELINLLAKLDKQLTSPYDVVIVGGAAMILHFGAQRATRDVDILVLKGNTFDHKCKLKDLAVVSDQ